MAETQETTDDIIAEVRDNRGFPVPYSPEGFRAIWLTDVMGYVDRLEAAHRRDSGDAAKLREALELARLYISLGPKAGFRAHVKDGEIVMHFAINVLDEISAALAEPQRNCDRSRNADAGLKPDPRWKERCEKCFENNACEPPDCRYFDGEDCQSPIPGQHPMAQPGNVAALREALDYCRDMVADLIHHIGHDEDYLEREMKELVAKCNIALSAPPRNCEVGTLTEQQQRFHDFCEKMQHTDKACCGGCPIVHLRVKGVIGNSCELAWAQMPYEEGGAK